MVLILGLTFYGIFHDENPAVLFRLLDQANGWYWIGGIVLVLLFISCESLIIRLLLRFVGQSVRQGHCLMYSFVGFFFSGITPSAGGGQPAQIYFMHKDGLDPGVTTPILVIVTIGYKMVLVIYGVVALILRPGVLTRAPEPVMWWCFLGLILNCVVIAGFCMLIFHQPMVEALIGLLLRLLGRFIQPERIARWQNRLDETLEKYREVVTCIHRDARILPLVAVISIVQRTLLFAVPWLVLRSFGILGGSLPEVILMQALVCLGTDLLPLPGGTGANEALFIMLFEGLCGDLVVLPVLMASRGISYYGQVLISGIVALMAGIVMKKRGKMKDDRIL